MPSPPRTVLPLYISISVFVLHEVLTGNSFENVHGHWSSFQRLQSLHKSVGTLGCHPFESAVRFAHSFLSVSSTLVLYLEIVVILVFFVFHLPDCVLQKGRDTMSVLFSVLRAQCPTQNRCSVTCK